MPNKILFLLFITLELFSITLNKTYYVNSSNIKLLDLIPDAKYDVTLYKIDDGKYTKRVRVNALKKELSKHGFNSLKSSGSYVKFIKKSPIDTSKIRLEIKENYISKYPNIKIKSITVFPRGYLKSIPKNYEVILPKKAYLSKKGTISIKTLENKKIFFDYLIDAKIDVYLSKFKIKKGEKLSTFNTIRTTINFNKFKALPIDIKYINTSQIKFHTKKEAIITTKNIEGLTLIKKGSIVNVTLENKNLNISFSAKSLQNGKLQDIITVKKSDGKKFLVKVIGKNQVEMR